MKVWVELPDRLADEVARDGRSLPQAAIEAMAVDAYRMERLSGVELCDMLGLSSRDALDAFLKAHGVPLDYSAEDFERESETSARLWEKRQAEISGPPQPTPRPE